LEKKFDKERTMQYIKDRTQKGLMLFSLQKKKEQVQVKAYKAVVLSIH
jgi:hypothetical protein